MGRSINGKLMLTPRQKMMLDIADVAKTHRLHPNELMGRGRLAEVVNARQAAYWLIWYKYDLSLLKLAKLFGKDHATIMRGIGKHMGRCNIDHPWVELHAKWCEQMASKYKTRSLK